MNFHCLPIDRFFDRFFLSKDQHFVKRSLSALKTSLVNFSLIKLKKKNNPKGSEDTYHSPVQN